MASDFAYGREAVIDRKALKKYTDRRSDASGLLFLARHLAALVVTGSFVVLTFGTWWILPAIILHGMVMALLFAPVHECSHATPFRTRWLNEGAFWLVCLIYMVPPNMFRHSHLAHHRYTQIRGSDPDMVLPRNSTVWDYLYYVSAIPFWIRGFDWMISLPFGKISEKQRLFIPDGTINKTKREGRIILFVYASIFLGAVIAQSWMPLWLWILPRFLGEPFMRWLRIAEHAECEESADLSRNTRTTRAPGWLHALFWNMSYHSEHHLCPAVPFHVLPEFHEVVGGKLYPVASGYTAVHREVLSNLLSHQGVTWAESQAGTG
jgi:fatty acid desaturase